MEHSDQERIIAVTTFNRSAYFEQEIDALERCRGIERYRLMCFMDGGYPEEQDNMEQRLAASSIRHEVFRRTKNLGCNANIFYALSTAFETGADWVIFMEDDVIPTTDFLIYMEQTLESLESYECLFSVSGYSPSPPVLRSAEHPQSGTMDHWRASIEIPFAPVARPDAVGLWGWSCSWGMGLWRSRWEDSIRRQWSQTDLWDCHLNFHVRRDRLGVFPMLSRVQNVGEFGGVSYSDADNVFADEHHTDNMHKGEPVACFDLQSVKRFLEQSC